MELLGPQSKGGPYAKMRAIIQMQVLDFYCASTLEPLSTTRVSNRSVGNRDFAEKIDHPCRARQSLIALSMDSPGRRRTFLKM